MKKLILTTSALTFMGGAAFAGMNVTGEASVAYGNWGTAPGTAAAFSFNTKLTIAMEEMAGGLTYGAKVSIDADAGTVSDGVIYVSGGFGKVSFGIDQFDELKANDFPAATDAVNGVTKTSKYGDVKYEGTFGAVKMTLVADAGLGDTPRTPSGVAATEAVWDLGLKYDGGSWSLGVDADSTNAYKVSASVTAGNFTFGAAVDQASSVDLSVKTAFSGINAKLTADDVTGSPVYGLALDGKAGNVKWAVSGDSGGRTKASVDYSMDALSVGLAYDNKDAGTAGLKDRGDEADLQLTVGYKVSDNLKFKVKANDVSEYEVSMTAGFTF